MTHSIFLAKILGPYCLIAGVGMLLNRNDIQKIIDDVSRNVSVRFTWAVLALVFGLLIVNVHNVWEVSWVVLITILGWMSLMKGIMYFLFPSKIEKMARIYQNNSKLLTINLSIWIVLGVFLISKGYF